MSSVPEVDFTVRALEIGDIVLIALDGNLPDDFDRLRLKQSRKVVAEARASELGLRKPVIFLSAPGASGERFLTSLAVASTRDDTAAVMILPRNPETSGFELSFLRGRSRLGGASIFSASAVSAVAGAPVGNIVSVFAAGGLDETQSRPVPVIGGRALPLIEREAFGPLVACRYRIPVELFDGETHAFTLLPEDGQADCAITEWTCQAAHVFKSGPGPTHARKSPSPFPDHEVGRVSAFAERTAASAAEPDSATIAAWQAGQNAPASPPLRLFVFDMTLKGALATPAAMQLRALHRDWLETTVVLPTAEAVRFGAEMTRDSAVTQFVDIATVTDLALRIEAQPNDAVIIAVPGGSSLTQEAIDEIYAVIAGKSSGLCTAITHKVPAAPLTLNVTENDEAPLDLSRGAAIFSKKEALAKLAFSSTIHEGAVVPRTLLTRPLARHVAEKRQAVVADGSALCCVIDAQAGVQPDVLIPILEKLVAGSVSVIVISGHAVIRKVSETAGLEAVRTIVSPYGVWPEFEGELFRDNDKPVINISFELLAILAAAVEDPVPLLASAAHYTTLSSICTLARRGGAAAPLHDEPVLGYFRCAKVA